MAQTIDEATLQELEGEFLRAVKAYVAALVQKAQNNPFNTNPNPK